MAKKVPRAKRPKRATRRAKKGDKPTTDGTSRDVSFSESDSGVKSPDQIPQQQALDDDQQSVESNFSDQYDRAETDFDVGEEEQEPKWAENKFKIISKSKPSKQSSKQNDQDDNDGVINDLDWNEDEDEEYEGQDNDQDEESDGGELDDDEIERTIDQHAKRSLPSEGWQAPGKVEEPDETDPKKLKELALKKRLMPAPKIDPETGVQYPSDSLMSQIRNKQRRRQLYEKFKAWKKKEKIKSRKEKRKAAEEAGEDYVKPVPKTIESERVPEETWVNDDDAEAQIDIDLDEMSSYFRREYEPKVLITSSDNPHTRTIQFCRELKQTIPNAEFRWRNRSAIKKIVVGASQRGYTDLIVVHEDWRRPTGMILCHLPGGPTAYFKMTNVRLCRQIKRGTTPSSHRPEVILNNFNTRVGHTVGRMLGCLFHYDPQFKGRNVVTFHNQRDYIFFRHHRYQFTANGTRVALAEIGPRFTLKLRAVQKGTFDPRYGEFEWVLKRHEMQDNRRRFML